MKKNTGSVLSDRQAKSAVKQSQEIRELNFAAGLTLIIAIILAAASYDFAGHGFKTAPLLLAAVFAAEALVTFLIQLKVRRELVGGRKISRSSRLLGILLILTLATCNIFTCAAGFLLVKERRSLEYHIGIYMFFVEVVILVVSAINLFKGYVISTYFPAMGVLAVLAVFHLISLFFLGSFVTANKADKRLLPLAILLIASAVCGNLLALLVGGMVIRKIYNKDEEISVNWIDIFKRLFRSQVAVLGLFFIILLLSMTFWANYTFDYSLAVDNNYGAILQAPSLQYPLGTDDYGRCVFTRVIFGAKISLAAGLLSTMISVVIGLVLGAVAGYYSSRVDNVIMRILDIFMAIPGLLLPIAIITATGTNLACIIFALGMGVIPGYGRTVRASVMTLKGSEFIEAARACGAKNSTIIFKHIVPNSLAPVIVRATMGFGGSVLAVSSLSYLGVGIESHIPEWGNILKAGSTYLETHSYLAIYPGIVIVLLVLAFNFLGDGLRDALDPKLK